ncbi:hypothetical protein CC78DRAFT_546151 [Lojkania enalia]|uniref:Uncharacterized protein n=1 Tax=Lojkania enalia TaxID=147567 RepID=A0A9P4MY60_9PLEO|nr:hypothetical protein CC78DRAFT_546151 [Didymosphaeria enalia]
MVDGAAAESHTGSQIHPLLRQRMLNRAATFSEGAQLVPPVQRRRSSVLSDYSDTRQSYRSSTDNLLRSSGNDMDTITSSDEPSVWHSAPLVFAILPAVGGLFFQNGSAVVTDVLLLALASMFLNWCVRAPWDWYHAAQHVQYVEADDLQTRDTILEEDEENEGSEDMQDDDRPKSPELDPSSTVTKTAEDMTTAQGDARRSLGREAFYALMTCFGGPLLGAYLLHTIRSQLTRPSEGLVSNYNLTIFVMAAELRPVSHVIKMKKARMAHLQRLVRVDTKDGLTRADTVEISQRLADVEARLAESSTTSESEAMKISSNVRQGLQPQLDALNRAVRRYEKRQAAQSIQIEARFAELDLRLKDALSLAAVAARTGQQPGLVSICLTWVANTLARIFQMALVVFMYPFRIATAIAAEVKSWFVQPVRQPRKGIKTQTNGHSSYSTPRIQSRNGR